MKTKIKFSKAHTDYLRKHTTKKVLIILTQIIILVAFILGWELLSKYEIISSFFFSSPSKIIKTIAEMYANGELIYHSKITLTETLIGFIIATVLGFAIAFLLWYSTFLKSVIEPYLVVLNSLPKISLLQNS